MLVFKKHNYTLIELVAVIVIAGLLSTVVISQFSKLPAFVSLESKVNEFSKILAQARNNASCRGVNTTVVFEPENLRVFMPQKSSDGQKLSPIEMHLLEEIKLSQNDKEIDSENENITLFKFYPDGTSDGKSLCLELRKHKFKISISPLSGSIIAEEINEQQ